MSNFYYCNDCKKPTDLITAGKKLAEYHVDNISEEDKVCYMCWSTNWHAEIDMGKDGYKQVREKE